mmetsp:Transcript_18256/g.28071  ORF Transcript_18256/g.28071 Transcript_18256/m.28071 type:complete len:187 (+) Transcript_18256:1386-1946(+)
MQIPSQSNGQASKAHPPDTSKQQLNEERASEIVSIDKKMQNSLKFSYQAKMKSLVEQEEGGPTKIEKTSIDIQVLHKRALGNNNLDLIWDVNNAEQSYLKQQIEQYSEQRNQIQQYLTSKTHNLSPQEMHSYSERAKQLMQQIIHFKNLEKLQQRLKHETISRQELVFFLRRHLHQGGGGLSGPVI